MALNLVALTAEVHNGTTVYGAAIKHMLDLKTQIAAGANPNEVAEQAQLDALVATLKSNHAAVTAAIETPSSTFPTAKPPA